MAGEYMPTSRAGRFPPCARAERTSGSARLRDRRLLRTLPASAPCARRAERVLADADEHEAAEPFRRARREPQEQQRAEREADRIDLFVGQRALDRRLEVRVLGGIVRRVGRSVAEQVDRDHRAGSRRRAGRPSPAPAIRARTTSRVRGRERRAGCASRQGTAQQRTAPVRSPGGR